MLTLRSFLEDQDLNIDEDTRQSLLVHLRIMEEAEQGYIELRELIDGGSESMTHDDAVCEIKDLQEAYPGSAPPPPKPKPLRYFNGRCLMVKYGMHGFICAHSKAEAVRLGKQAFGPIFTNNELNVYWSECWGISAEEVIGKQTEPGVFVAHRDTTFFKFVGRSSQR